MLVLLLCYCFVAAQNRKSEGEKKTLKPVMSFIRNNIHSVFIICPWFWTKSLQSDCSQETLTIHTSPFLLFSFIQMTIKSFVNQENMIHALIAYLICNKEIMFCENWSLTFYVFNITSMTCVSCLIYFVVMVKHQGPVMLTKKSFPGFWPVISQHQSSVLGLAP